MAKTFMKAMGLALLAGMTLATAAAAQQQLADGRGWDRGDRRWDGGHRHWGPRYDRWDWRGRPSRGYSGWRWNGYVDYWGPPRRVWAPGFYYSGRGDAWDVIAWGVLPALTFYALTEHARHSHEYAYNQALAAPVGETIIWDDDGARGSVRTTRDGYAGERYCREFQQTITIDGKDESGYGTACQEPDGSWRLVPNSDRN